MASDAPRILCTPRDHEIFHALARCPLTSEQLLKLSQTFSQPFGSDRPLRRRMQLLAVGGWVRCWPVASTSRGAMNYYKLTPTCFRLLNGPKAPLPSKGFFRPTSLALQEHTLALADFIVQTSIQAHRAGVAVTSFYRENDLRLTLDDQWLAPDCAFHLVTRHREFNYLVEIDNGTEPVTSNQDRDSLVKKIRFYDRYQSRWTHRFRVLTVFTKAGPRMEYFLRTAARLTENKQRRLFYAVRLDTFLDHGDPLRSPLFLDHHRRLQSLLPAEPVSRPAQSSVKQFDLAGAVC